MDTPGATNHAPYAIIFVGEIYSARTSCPPRRGILGVVSVTPHLSTWRILECGGRVDAAEHRTARSSSKASAIARYRGSFKVETCTGIANTSWFVPPTTASRKGHSRSPEAAHRAEAPGARRRGARQHLRLDRPLRHRPEHRRLSRPDHLLTASGRRRTRDHRIAARGRTAGRAPPFDPRHGRRRAPPRTLCRGCFGAASGPTPSRRTPNGMASIRPGSTSRRGAASSPARRSTANPSSRHQQGAQPLRPAARMI